MTSHVVRYHTVISLVIGYTSTRSETLSKAYHLVHTEEVPGSIPGVPTIFSIGYETKGSGFLALFSFSGDKRGGKRSVSPMIRPHARPLKFPRRARGIARRRLARNDGLSVKTNVVARTSPRCSEGNCQSAGAPTTAAVSADPLRSRPQFVSVASRRVPAASSSR